MAFVCSICQENLGDLDPQQRSRHIVFCAKVKAAEKKNVPVTDLTDTKTSSSSASTKVVASVSDTKKSATSRKISRNKLEQEFFKFPEEEQRKILESLSRSVKVEAPADSSTHDGAVAPTIVKTIAASKIESELFNLRMELGVVINSEAELRLKEKRIRTNIKRLSRKASVYEDQNLIFGQSLSEATARQALFPPSKYVSLSEDCLPIVCKAKCPLWQLSRLCELFEGISSSRVLDEERDAVIPLDADVACKHVATNKDLDWSAVGSTSVVQPVGTISTSAVIDCTANNSAGVIDLTVQSQSSLKSPDAVNTDATIVLMNCEKLATPPARSLFSQVVTSAASSVISHCSKAEVHNAATAESLGLVGLMKSTLESLSVASVVVPINSVSCIEECISKYKHQLSDLDQQELRWFGYDIIQSVQRDFESASEADQCKVLYSWTEKLRSLHEIVLSRPEFSDGSRCPLALLASISQFACSLLLCRCTPPIRNEVEDQVIEDVEEVIIAGDESLLSQGGFLMSSQNAVSPSLKRPLESDTCLSPIIDGPSSLVEIGDGQSSFKRHCVEESVNDEMVETTPPCTQAGHGYGMNNPIELITPSPAQPAAGSVSIQDVIAETLDGVAVDLTQLSTVEDNPPSAADKSSSGEELFHWSHDYFIYDQDFSNYDSARAPDPAPAAASSVAPSQSVASSIPTVHAPLVAAPSSSGRKSPVLAPPNNENVAQNQQQHLQSAAPKVVPPPTVTAGMSIDEALSAFIQNSSFYEDMLSFKPIDLDKLKYEFSSSTNMHVSDVYLLRYLDREGAFVSRSSGTGLTSRLDEE